MTDKRVPEIMNEMNDWAKAGDATEDGGPDDRLEGSLATAAWALAAGVSLVRVHDVAPVAWAARPYRFVEIRSPEYATAILTRLRVSSRTQNAPQCIDRLAHR